MNNKLLRQIAMAGKYTFYGILAQLVFVGILLAEEGQAQTIKSVKEFRITLDLNNQTIQETFKLLERMTDYYFAYEKDEIDGSIKLNKRFSGKSTISDVLLYISEEANLKFRQVNNSIIVTRKRKKGKSVDEKPLEIIIQGITITGKVISSENNSELPGVNVMVKGTSIGTVTDVEGNYIIEVPDENSVLIFSFVGYLKDEIVVGKRTVIDVALVPDITALEEIVVIGYGSVKKSDLTGSVARVKSEELMQVPSSGLNQAMQGRMAGVQVTQRSAAPGGGISVLIRGMNSINGDNAPLYVIDGFPLLDAGGTGTPLGERGRVSSFNPLSSINVNDIESIEVLKDASATAIYGSRGANGVVLVTTKQGKYGKSTISYDGYYGLQQVTKRYDMMNAREFAEFTNERYRNADPPRDIIFGGPDPAYPPPEELGEGTDWQDEIFTIAPIQNHQLSLSGSTKKLSHFISIGYFDQNGVIKNTGIKRASIRANVSGNHNNWLTYGVNLNYSYTDNKLANVEGPGFMEMSSVIAAALGMSPHYSTKPDERGFYEWMDIPNTATLDNPLSLIYNIQDKLSKTYFFGNTYLDFQILEGLNFKVSLGATTSRSLRDMYYPSNSRVGANYNGMAVLSSNSSQSWLNENTLSFTKSIKDIHDINVIAGFSLQGELYRSSWVQRVDFPRDVIKDNIGNGLDFLNPPQSDKIKKNLASFYGRINYTLKDKYLISLTGRSDGSSTFGANNKWAFFPAAAIAWRVINEDFIRDLNIFSDLKLRYSYGTSGNSGNAYQSVTRLASTIYLFGDVVFVAGFHPGNIPNNDLKWELTTTSNLGIDLGFFNNRLTITSDYYQKRTTDLLLNIPIPSSSGFQKIYANAGTLENTGFEFTANVVAIDKAFKWRFNANISFNRNKVIDLAGTDEFFFRTYPGLTGTLVRVGEPIGQWVEYEWDGIYKTEDELKKGPMRDSNTSVGDGRIVDQNKDGKINALDRVIIGDPNPDFYYGFSNNFKYKNFELDVFVQGVQGGDILNLTRATLIAPTAYVNQERSVFNRWTESNPDTDVPRNVFGANGTPISTRNVEDGTFVRLKNVTLAYNLKSTRVLKRARIYVSGTNLLTITSYKGYDPEVSASAGRLSSNIDNFNYPNYRTYTIGFVLDF